jgi:hypothetical protein
MLWSVATAARMQGKRGDEGGRNIRLPHRETRRALLLCEYRHVRLPQPPTEAWVLAATRCFCLTEVTHNGSTVVDTRPGCSCLAAAPLGITRMAMLPRALERCC